MKVFCRDARYSIHKINRNATRKTIYLPYANQSFLMLYDNLLINDDMVDLILIGIRQQLSKLQQLNFSSLILLTQFSK